MKLRRYIVAGLLVWIPLGVTLLLIGFALVAFTGFYDRLAPRLLRDRQKG